MNLLQLESVKGKRELTNFRKAHGIETPPPETPPNHKGSGLKEGALEHHRKNQVIREAKDDLKNKIKAFTEFVMKDPVKAMETLSQLATKVPLNTPTEPDEFQALCDEVAEDVYKAISSKVTF